MILLLIICNATSMDFASGIVNEKENVEIVLDKNLVDTKVLNNAQPAIEYTDSVGVKKSGVLLNLDKSNEWSIDLKQQGEYNIQLVFMLPEDTIPTSDFNLYINGEIQNELHQELSINRIWKNEEKEIQKDNKDNDIKPKQVPVTLWRTEYLEVISNYVKVPVKIQLSAGKNTIKIQPTRGEIVVSSISLNQKPTPLSYLEMKAIYMKNNYQKFNSTAIKYQAENANYKSDSSLYPTYDRASPLTEPYDGSKLLLNIIGGKNWGEIGQWIEYEVDIPQTGLYEISFRARQNTIRGIFASRKLYIDGVLPFSEAANLTFSYDSDWQIVNAGNKEENYEFYFEKGKHSIRLEATCGSMSDIMNDLKESLRILNECYRKIKMVVGGEVDNYRDYQFEQKIPDVISTLDSQSKILLNKYLKIIEQTGQKSSDVVILSKLARQLEDFVKDPRQIALRFSNFKTNLGSLGTYITQITKQPLDLDYFILSSSNFIRPNAKANFFQTLNHEMLAFIDSFFTDYNIISSDNSSKTKKIKVWMYSGRDQLLSLKSLIDDDFTTKTNIAVDLQLVQGGVLIPSIIANRSPDVVLEVGRSEPVNLALRGAILPISDFPDYKEIEKRFPKSAMVSYKLNAKIYALSETLIFPLLFYRTDILKQLNLKVPETWEDVSNIIPELQTNYMDFGIPIVNTLIPGDPTTFYTFLFQKNQSIYSADEKKINLHSDEAVEAFKTWTNYHNNFQLPLEYNFINRFRTGDMPIGIADYTTFNSLVASAPEIKGLWDFALVPGTKNEDGTINHSVPASGTSCVMMAQTKDKESSWEFMKWWTSSSAQMKYANEMENTLGASARYPTANMEALSLLRWTSPQYNIIKKQIEKTVGIPEVAGGYYVNRQINNAFRKVVVEKDSQVREIILDYEAIINNEIDLKRKEFKLG